MKRLRQDNLTNGGGPGFTLVELLVVITIIGILAGLILPALGGANEKARAVKTHAELYGLGLALEMYAMDNAGRYPPVRVNCNSDLSDHWCQLPVELVESQYLPGGEGGLAANIEDEFNPGHSYKYAAPGELLMNGSRTGERFGVWVPDDFPICKSQTGKYYRNPSESPVRWVVWSMGPKPKSEKSLSAHAPLAADTWYEHTGDEGVLARFSTAGGLAIKTP